MYLKNGREIYESNKYPGYFIDANTGAFCDEEGNTVGGNVDNGDKPGNYNTVNLKEEVVYVSRTGKQYYPKRTLSANIPMSLTEAKRKGYRASKGYVTYKSKKHRK